MGRKKSAKKLEKEKLKHLVHIKNNQGFVILENRSQITLTSKILVKYRPSKNLNGKIKTLPIQLEEYHKILKVIEKEGGTGLVIEIDNDYAKK